MGRFVAAQAIHRAIRKGLRIHVAVFAIPAVLFGKILMSSKVYATSQNTLIAPFGDVSLLNSSA